MNKVLSTTLTGGFGELVQPKVRKASDSDEVRESGGSLTSQSTNGILFKSYSTSDVLGSSVVAGLSEMSRCKSEQIHQDNLD